MGVRGSLGPRTGMGSENVSQCLELGPLGAAPPLLPQPASTTGLCLTLAVTFCPQWE